MICSYHYIVCMVIYPTSDNMNFICL